MLTRVALLLCLALVQAGLASARPWAYKSASQTRDQVTVILEDLAQADPEQRQTEQVVFYIGGPLTDAQKAQIRKAIGHAIARLNARDVKPPAAPVDLTEGLR